MMEPANPANVAPAINWAIWKQCATYDLPELAAILAKVDPALPDQKASEAAGFLRLIQEETMNRNLPMSRDRNAAHYEQPDTWPHHFYVTNVDALKWV
jgi:hypothetical protein